jgi:hypothetical protein
MMAVVPEPITVWMVRLERGRTDVDVKGRLSLEEDALVFRDLQEQPVRFAFEEVRRAKRLRGSPVLMVTWIRQATEHRTAFYFTPPPPMEPAETTPGSGFGALRRPKSKRRQSRDNVRYLQMSNSVRKPTIQAWADEVTARIPRSGS